MFTAGILVFSVVLFLLLRQLQAQREVMRPRARKRAGLYRLIFMLAGLALVLLAQPIFWVSGQLRAYKLIRPGEPFCFLDIYTPADRVPRLIYSTTGESGDELVEVFPVRDSSMRITGEIIEWPEWLAPLGLGTFFKLTRVEFVRVGPFGETTATCSRTIHRGSMPIFRRLAGWPSKLSLAHTRIVQTPVLDADNDLSYNVFIKNGELVLE